MAYENTSLQEKKKSEEEWGMENICGQSFA